MSKKHGTYGRDDCDDRHGVDDQVEHDYDDVDYDDPKVYDEEDEIEDEESSERRLLKSWEGRVGLALLLSLGLTLGGVMIWRFMDNDAPEDGVDASRLDIAGDPTSTDGSATPSTTGTTGTPSTSQTQVVTPQPSAGSTAAIWASATGGSSGSTATDNSSAYPSAPASSTGAYGGTGAYSGTTGAYGGPTGTYSGTGAYGGTTAQAGTANTTTGQAGTYGGSIDATPGLMRLTPTVEGSANDAQPYYPGSAVVESVPNNPPYGSNPQGTSTTINVIGTSGRQATTVDPTSPMIGYSQAGYQNPAAQGGASTITPIPRRPNVSADTTGGSYRQAGGGYTQPNTSQNQAGTGYGQPNTGYQSESYSSAYGDPAAASTQGFSTTTTAREYEQMTQPGGYQSPSGATGDGRYIVQPNENYWRISERVYGVGNYFRALAEHNRSAVPREDELAIGDEIETPAVEILERDFPDLCPTRERVRSLAGRTDTSRRLNPMVQPGEVIYEVQNGDSLFDIARYELDDVRLFMEIYNRNRAVIGDDFNYLTPGMRLVLPAKQGAITAVRNPTTTEPRYAQTPNYDTRSDYPSGSTTVPYRSPQNYETGTARTAQPPLQPAKTTGGYYR